MSITQKLRNSENGTNVAGFQFQTDWMHTEHNNVVTIAFFPVEKRWLVVLV